MLVMPTFRRLVTNPSRQMQQARYSPFALRRIRLKESRVNGMTSAISNSAHRK